MDVRLSEVTVHAEVFLIENEWSSRFLSLPLSPDCHTCQHIDTKWERAHTVLENQNLPHQSRVLGAGGGSLLPCFPSLFPSFSFSFPSHTFSSQSPRAETLMKTNARNQFAASSFHLAGARLCTSISTAAGGELLQSSPITHTSVLRNSYRLRALLREKCIKMGGMCYLKLSSENLFFF